MKGPCKGRTTGNTSPYRHLKGDLNREGKVPYGHFGDRYFQQATKYAIHNANVILRLLFLNEGVEYLHPLHPHMPPYAPKPYPNLYTLGLPPVVIVPSYGVNKGLNIPTIVSCGTHCWAGD